MSNSHLNAVSQSAVQHLGSYNSLTSALPQISGPTIVGQPLQSGIYQQAPPLNHVYLNYLEKIEVRMRMHLWQITQRGIELCYAGHRAGRVHVFMFVGDSPLIMEDDDDLFPSDGFITKLKTLMDG